MGVPLGPVIIIIIIIIIDIMHKYMVQMTQSYLGNGVNKEIIMLLQKLMCLDILEVQTNYKYHV